VVERSSWRGSESYALTHVAGARCSCILSLTQCRDEVEDSSLGREEERMSSV
jgi:hypothetical protein